MMTRQKLVHIISRRHELSFDERVDLRNELDFLNVHGIKNTSDLLQSKWSPKGLKLTLQEIEWFTYICILL